MGFEVIVQALIQKKFYKSCMEKFYREQSIDYEFSSDRQEFIARSITRRPNVFFIQADIGSSIDILTLVTDIKVMFGIMATIVVIGDNMPFHKLTSFLEEGADQFFPIPFDYALIEDFLRKRTGSSYYNAFVYRNVPSGRSGMDIIFEIRIIEINSGGVCFFSEHLIKRGTILTLDLNEISDDFPFIVETKIIQSEKVSDKEFKFIADFIDMNDNIRNVLFETLRNMAL